MIYCLFLYGMIAIELIPNCQKEAYLEAKRQCPILIEKEPGLMRFLEYDRFDVWAAARRLVKYWSMRKDLFQERAFLPMHQTGNGALSKTDLQVLATGFASILPAKNTNGDSFVYCYIPSRLDKDSDIMISRRRCSFYMFSVLMNLNAVSKNTFSGIMMLNQIGYQRTLMGKPTVEMVKLLPVFADYGVIAHCPMDVERKTFFEMLAPTVMKLLERDGGNNVVEAVSGSSKQDLADQLATCGFCRESLPTECGGTWSVAKFRQWQLERIELERQRELEYFGVARMASAVANGDLEPRKWESSSANFIDALRTPYTLATLDELEKRWAWENLTGGAQFPLSPTAALDELEHTLDWEYPGLMPPMPSFPSTTMNGLEQSFENDNCDDDGEKKPAACDAKTMEYKRRVAEALKEDEMLRSTCCEAERLERKRILDREHSKKKRARRKDRLASLQESHFECVVENARLKKESSFLKRLLMESEKVIKRHLSEKADGSVSRGDRQAAVVASTANQRQGENDDVGYVARDRQSADVASSHVNHGQRENDDGPVSIDRMSVTAASSSTSHQQRFGRDESMPASLPESLPINIFMNRHPDDAASHNRQNPLTTAVDAFGTGVYESVHNQLVATSAFPSCVAPSSWSNSLAHAVAGPDVTNNVTLLNLWQQQQQPPSFPQVAAGRIATHNGNLLTMLLQQQLVAQSHQSLVYPSFNNAMHSNNHLYTTTRHQFSSEEENNDSSTAPFL
jgi:hypothetical protein